MAVKWFRVSGTVNYPDREVELVSTKDMPTSPKRNWGAVEDWTAQVVKDHPKATSYVFVVVPL